MYSTISYHNYIVHKDVTTCQHIGICLQGSKVFALSYPDPGYCDERTTCPRLYMGSTPGSNVVFSAYDFQGMGTLRRPGHDQYDFQRPALYVFYNYSKYYNFIFYAEDFNIFYFTEYTMM